MLREKLAENSRANFKTDNTDDLGCGCETEGEFNERVINEQITIFKEMLDTMELPKAPIWATFGNIGVPGADHVYKVAQQDLLKAIKEECDKDG